MPPDILTSQYLQYKADTDAVASWLARTARLCGYPADLLHHPQSTQRLKGKQRKKGKNSQGKAKPPTAGSSSKNPQPADPPTYTIALKDFTGLAEFIAGSTKAATLRVPRSFNEVLERAISLRKSHGAQISAIAKTSGDDAKHSYFVSILERVQEILRPRMPSDVVKDFATADKSAKTDELRNQFAGLEVQEPSEEFLRVSEVSVVAPEGPAEPEPNYRAERLQDRQEAVFLFYLLLEDMTSIREAVINTWINVTNGIFDLVSASVMTNTAIDLVRRFEEELAPIFDKYDGSQAMYEFYIKAQVFSQGHNPSYHERVGDDINFRAYDVLESHYFTTYLLLNSFRAVVGPNDLPEYKPGYFGTYDLSSDWEAKTNRQKYAEDKALLLEILPEFAAACLLIPDLPGEDELIRGLRDIFKHKAKPIPIWLIFATQIFLDLHHHLRKDVEFGFQELKRQAGLISKTIKENFEFHKQNKSEKTWPAANDRVLEAAVSWIGEIVENDLIHKAKPRRTRSPDFKLMKHHPIFCGLVLYDIRARYHETGVSFAGAWGSIMNMEHLYNALRSEKLLESPWTDMELAEAFQRESVFVGEPPTTVDGYFKSWFLSSGGSAASFASNKQQHQQRRQKKGIPLSKKGPKSLTEKGPISQMFKHRYCRGSGRTDLSVDDIKTILEKATWIQQPSEGGHHLIFDNDGAKNNPPVRFQPGAPVPVADLLTALRNALCAEKAELSFDYFLMHRVCWTALRQINTHCRPLLTDLYGAGYLAREDQLPYIVGYIFAASADVETIKGAAGAAAAGEEVNVAMRPKYFTKALLQRAARAVQEMIDGEGGGKGAATNLREFGVQFCLSEEEMEREIMVARLIDSIREDMANGINVVLTNEDEDED